MEKIFRFFKHLRVLATMTLRELIDEKIFLLFFPLIFLFLGIGFFLAMISLQEKELLFRETVSGLFSLFLSLLAIVVSATQCHARSEKIFLFSRGIARWEYFLGKLMGVILLLLVASGLFVINLLFIQLYWHDFSLKFLFLRSLAGSLLQASLLATMTFCIATTARSSLFTMVTMLFVYFIGHASLPLQELAEQVGPFPSWIEKGIKILWLPIPSWSLFQAHDDAVGSMMQELTMLSEMLKPFGFYVAIYTILGCWMFEREER